MERKGFICLLFLALAGSGSVRGADESTLIRLDAPVSRELHAGEAHVFRLPLKAGDYARIEIAQQGVDVVTVLRDPAGSTLADFDSPTGPQGTDVVAFVAAAPGEYGLEVKGYFKEKAGRYQLTLVALRAADRNDRLRVEALTLTRLGMTRSDAGQSREALAAWEQALADQRALGDREGIADTLSQIGRISRILGDRNRSLAAYEETIALWRELEKPHRLGRSLLGAGDAHQTFGELDDALAAYEQALELSLQTADASLQASALNFLGQIHIRLGQPLQALSELRNALDLARRIDRRDLEAEVSTNLGGLYRNLGMPREALDHFASALEVFRQSGNLQKQAAVLTNLGSLLFQLGSPEDARELLLKALPLCLDPRDRALALVTLSRVDEQLGHPAEAASRLDEALTLQQTVADRNGEAETLRARGILFLEMGEPERARKALAESVDLFDRLNLRSGAIAARRGLARAQADLGDLESARKGFEEARRQAEALEDVGEQALALAEAGRLEQEAGRLTEARERLESALALIESFRSEIGGDRLRVQHFAKVRETYERYVDVLMQAAHRAGSDAGLVAKAFEAAERSRARSLLDVLTRARVETRGGDPELMERELHLRQELNAKAAARMELPPGSRSEALRQEIQALSVQHRIAESLLTGESSYAALTQPSLRVPEVQGLLDSGTALLEYLLGERRSYVWVITQDSLAAYELPGRQEIEALARQLHESLSDPSERDASGQRRTLDRLAREVIAPVLSGNAAGLGAGLDGKRLAIVADGALQYIPFAALPIASRSPAPGTPATQPLVAGHETVLLPSAAVLKEIRRASSARPRSPLSLAILADPAYGDSEPTAPSLPRILPAASRGPGLEELSWSRREAEQIAAVAAGHEVLLALGPAATRELAISEKLSRFRILHFATHGFLDDDHPELSGLAFARFDKSGRPIDGFLRLQDLYSLHLQADLVVLSGCETGLGRDLRGEGLLGLTHGFFHAGASQVVASLWPVRDRAAAELMQRFYRAMLSQGMRPAAALRAAQLEMAGQRTWRDPYFWASFVAQGDWTAGAF